MNATQWLPALLLSTLVGCAAARSGTRPETASPPPPPPASEPTATGGPAQAPLIGWNETYDAHAFAHAQHLPALLEIAPERMAGVCPRWSELNREARAQFYADLLFAIAKPESGHDRCAMFRETTLVDSAGHPVIDEVTGSPVVSEGLLQLSYADSRAYPSAEGLSCDFDWKADREAFWSDLTAGKGRRAFRSTNPGRTLLDPYRQLTCGLHILRTLVVRSPQRSFTEVAGRYWSTMRPSHSTHAAVLAALRERKSPCF